MEGDGPTGALVLPKYLELKELLEEKIETARQTKAPLYPFYTAMLERVQKYLDMAMECEKLILATIVHPCFRLHIFELGFGVNSVESKRCLELLKSHFKTYQDLRETLEKETSNEIQAIPDPSDECNTSRLMSCLESCVTKNSTSVADKIGKYLKIKLNSKEFKVNDLMMPLKWWKAHSDTFPTLSLLAHDYLG
ncbi:hypothetical protein PCANC_23481 [Puccinia coronata f. sp. avenae]|uniref:HAT C-terminal dimerisation domain-containing protein n=1 Tax=Puccinia coronata f. sp. avenae TaxID=200324 RepID=A0A2N5TT82_9BASI|nr:hypothetical protein PCANC_23481 [Puccinia coronata f. sp. avenae]PLW45457.1 hypothetical protein PCASD_05958 [Puccinia coronata f. sp. avenae]